MKYIVGASIGGLFGIGAPMMLDVNKIDNNDNDSRIEESQPTEEDTPVPIDSTLILPDNVCGYIKYKSDEIKEQAKECLEYSLPAIPAI
jgi:hypothetical protein